MADTTVLTTLPAGLSSPVLMLASVASPDVIVNGAGDGLTENSNMLGEYAATVAESLIGLHKVVVEDASGAVLLRGYVSLADDAGPYDVCERVLLVSGVKEAEVSLSAGIVAADATKISGDAAAADNLEALLDGTGGITLQGDLSGSVGSVLGGLNTTAGAVTTLDGLNTELGALDAKVDAILADTGTTGVTLSAATLNAIADALLDRADGVEPAASGEQRTVRESLRLILSATAGKLSGAEGNTITIRDANDTKNRITATVDNHGNRTSVTLDAS